MNGLIDANPESYRRVPPESDQTNVGRAVPPKAGLPDNRAYQRIGWLLSTMGFQKGKAGNNSAILWNEERIDQIVETFLPSPRREEGTLHSPYCQAHTVQIRKSLQLNWRRTKN